MRFWVKSLRQGTEGRLHYIGLEVCTTLPCKTLGRGCQVLRQSSSSFYPDFRLTAEIQGPVLVFVGSKHRGGTPDELYTGVV